MTAFRRLARTVFGIGVVVLLVGSLLPSDVLPQTGLTDKWQHFVAYSILMAAFAVGAPVWKRQITGAAMLFALGVAIEVLQSFVPGREPSVLDALANLIGVLIGLGVGTVFNSAISNTVSSTD